MIPSQARQYLRPRTPRAAPFCADGARAEKVKDRVVVVISEREGARLAGGRDGSDEGVSHVILEDAAVS